MDFLDNLSEQVELRTGVQEAEVGVRAIAKWAIDAEIETAKDGKVDSQYVVLMAFDLERRAQEHLDSVLNDYASTCSGTTISDLKGDPHFQRLALATINLTFWQNVCANAEAIFEVGYAVACASDSFDSNLSKARSVTATLVVNVARTYIPAILKMLDALLEGNLATGIPSLTLATAISTANIKLTSSMPQLYKAVGGRRNTLIDEALQETPIAWAEEESMMPDIKKLRNRVVRGITADSSSRVVKYLEVERPRDTGYDPELAPELTQELHAHESARAELATLKDEAGLSKREREVLDFRLQGYKEDEIATMLGIAKGTVKALAFRARGKLLRPAS